MNKILSFIKEATKALREHGVKEPYYIKLHEDCKPIPISDVKNILIKNGEIVKAEIAKFCAVERKNIGKNKTRSSIEMMRGKE